MKIKRDFVTNSSSTSFILCVESDIDNILEFVNKYNMLLNEISDKNSWKDDYELPPVLFTDRVKKGELNTYLIEDYLPFYETEDDLPQYIKELVDERNSAIDAHRSEKYRINRISIETKDRNAEK